MTGHVYIVTVEGLGDVQRMADSIGEARAWAKGAFGRRPHRVRRSVEARPPCANCGSRPCCCTPKPKSRCTCADGLCDRHQIEVF